MGGCAAFLRCLEGLGPRVIEACREGRHPGPRDLGHGAPALELQFWQQGCAPEMRPRQRAASHVLGGVPFSFPAPHSWYPLSLGQVMRGGGHRLAKRGQGPQGEAPTCPSLSSDGCRQGDSDQGWKPGGRGIEGTRDGPGSQEE